MLHVGKKNQQNVHQFVTQFLPAVPDQSERERNTERASERASERERERERETLFGNNVRNEGSWARSMPTVRVYNV